MRRSALRRLLAWGLASLALALLLLWFFSKPGRSLWINVVGAAVPGAMTLAYLLELISGVPMSEWERRWAGLSGGKKLLLSIAILGAAFFIFTGIALTLVLTGLV